MYYYIDSETSEVIEETKDFDQVLAEKYEVIYIENGEGAKGKKLVGGTFKDISAEEQKSKLKLKQTEQIPFFDIAPGLAVSGVSPTEMAWFGNVWVRKMYFPKAGAPYQGHKHDHDHVSLLMSGKVLVEVAGHSKEFTAPAIIIIRKDYEHKITALEDKTLWWCVHALSEVKGIDPNVDGFYTVDQDPLELENQAVIK